MIQGLKIPDPTYALMHMDTRPVKIYSADEALSSDIDAIRNTLMPLLQEGVKLPTWNSPTCPFQQHITDLRIPRLADAPSLLLHRLGALDVNIEHRVRKVFSGEQATRSAF
jgi:hypothetical protein